MPATWKARADTASYRARKFFQRNRAITIAAVLLLFSLFGGVAATIREAHRARAEEQLAQAEKAQAERRFNDVRQLAHSVLFDYHDAIKSLPGSIKVRERLVHDAVTYLDSLAVEAGGDAALQRELAGAYERVGDVRGGLTNGSHNDIAGALESYGKALKIYEALVARNPKDEQALRGLASSHHKIGHRMYDTSQLDEAGIPHLRQAHELYLKLTRNKPGDEQLQLELANTCIDLGTALPDTDKARFEFYRAAQAICEKLLAAHPEEQTYRYALWTNQYRLSYALYLQNNLAAAFEAGKKATELGEELVAEDPLNADYRRMLARTYQSDGIYRQDSDKNAAIACFRKAITIEDELLAADPSNALIRKDLATTHKRAGDTLAEMNDNVQTLVHYTQAFENYSKVVTESPHDLICQFLVVTCQAGVASMQARLGHLDAALAQCQGARAFLQKITGVEPGYLGKAQACEYLGDSYEELAKKSSGAAAKQRMKDAREMLQQSLNVVNEARSSGTVAAHDNEQWANGLAAELAKCDAALAK